MDRYHDRMSSRLERMYDRVVSLEAQVVVLKGRTNYLLNRAQGIGPQDEQG